jgi:hypothetical protein
VLGHVLSHVLGHMLGHMPAMARHRLMSGWWAVRAIVLAANRQCTRRQREIEPGDRERIAVLVPNRIDRKLNICLF